jgi:hypothetical protein
MDESGMVFLLTSTGNDADLVYIHSSGDFSVIRHYLFLILEFL